MLRIFNDFGRKTTNTALSNINGRAITGLDTHVYNTAGDCSICNLHFSIFP